jgi:hypothetical protein
VTPRATVQPCVYWPGGGAPLDLLLERGADIAESEIVCRRARRAVALSELQLCRTCSGGCAGRRRLLDALDAPDPYCPGRPRRRPQARGAGWRGAASCQSWESACTTIVMAR